MCDGNLTMFISLLRNITFPLCEVVLEVRQFDRLAHWQVTM